MPFYSFELNRKSKKFGILLLDNNTAPTKIFSDPNAIISLFFRTHIISTWNVTKQRQQNPA